MITWGTVAPGIRDLISTLAFPNLDPAFLAQWRGRSREHVNTHARAAIFIEITHDRDHFTESRYEEERLRGNDALVEHIVGERHVTLQVTVESYENTDCTWAWATVERLRTKLRLDRSNRELEALNCAIVRIEAAVGLPLTKDKRVQSRAAFDLVLACGFDYGDDRDTGWIEGILLTSELLGEDGTLLPSPPNYTDLPIP